MNWVKSQKQYVSFSSVEVMDVLGCVIDRQMVSNIAQSAELTFARPAAAGKYSVKVTDSKGSVVRSLIVQ